MNAAVQVAANWQPSSSMDRSISTHNLRPHADFDCRYQSGGSGPNGGPVLMPAGDTDPPRGGARLGMLTCDGTGNTGRTVTRTYIASSTP